MSRSGRAAPGGRLIPTSPRARGRTAAARGPKATNARAPGRGGGAPPAAAAAGATVIRSVVTETHDAEAATSLRVLYGGSVNPGNIAAFMAKREVDGAPVGRAAW